jgi:kynurenine 3-monooxygenase
MAPHGQRWKLASDKTEDMSLTPAERAEFKAKGEARARQLDEEERLFMADDVEKTEVGGGSGNDCHEMVVLGAGLVGCLCAVVLLRKGFKVKVFERYADIRSIPSAGRSINLSVTSRGLRAIRALGGTLYDDLLGLATKIRGRIIHLADGNTIFQRYGKDDSECNYSVSRYELNAFLLDLAAREGAELYFDHILSETSDFSGDGNMGCVLNFLHGSDQQKMRKRVKVHCPVIACDGAGSRARCALGHQGLTTYTENLLTRGYKEVLFPNPGEGNDFGCKGEDGGEPCEGQYGLHIWPRGDHMLMALANRDGSFTGTIYMDSKGPTDSFEALAASHEKCKDFVAKNYSHAVPCVGGMDNFVKQVTDNPDGILGTVWTSRWAVEAKVLLIGDASHAMVPFFGQGCNCGFEDVRWLSKLLDEHCGDGTTSGLRCPEKCTAANFSACFRKLEEARKPNADAICDMALENFVEMRDKTGDRKFQAMKRVENKLENQFGHKFRSRYAMVCYGGEGNVSYSNAMALGMTQNEILSRLCSHMIAPNNDSAGNIGSEEAMHAQVELVDMDFASKLIDEMLVPEQQKLGIDLTTVRH